MKFKVGDTVKIKKDLSEDDNDVYCMENSHIDAVVVYPMERFFGKEAIITGCNHQRYQINLDADNHNWVDEMFEDKGVKKVKKEKRKYIVVSENGNTVLMGTVETKKIAMSLCTQPGHYIIDISKAPRYNKVIKARMVEIKPEKKIVKKTKKIKK